MFSTDSRSTFGLSFAHPTCYLGAVFLIYLSGALDWVEDTLLSPHFVNTSRCSLVYETFLRGTKLSCGPLLPRGLLLSA